MIPKSQITLHLSREMNRLGSEWNRHPKSREKAVRHLMAVRFSMYWLYIQGMYGKDDDGNGFWGSPSSCNKGKINFYRIPRL